MKAKRGDPSSGLVGAGLWARDQNALQKGALVKEPPVDVVWETERVVILFPDALRPRRISRHVPGPGHRLEGCDETGSGNRDVL